MKKHILYPEFAANLRIKMAIKNIGTKGIADKLDVTQATVSNWRRGHAIPCTDNLYQLASLLGMDATELLGTN